MRITHYLLTGFILAAAALNADAHYLWIETQGSAEVRVYFGEYQEGLREKRGGRLDERDGLRGWSVSANRATNALPFTKQADHFAAALVKQQDWVLVQDTGGEVKDWRQHDIGIVKPMFYARAAAQPKPGGAAPTLPLDILPDPENPHVLRVFFKQQPLPKAKVFVYAPNQWMQELRTDESGQVKISAPWPGRYVIDVIHKERQPGEFAGKAYEAIRHRATFSHLY